jgi:hypothetical protein
MEVIINPSKPMAITELARQALGMTWSVVGRLATVSNVTYAPCGPISPIGNSGGNHCLK